MVYLCTWTSASLCVNIFSDYFPGCLQPSLFGAKDANAKIAGTESAYDSSTCIKSSCKNSTFAKSTYIGYAFIGNTCTGSAHAKGACVGTRNLMF